MTTLPVAAVGPPLSPADSPPWSVDWPWSGFHTHGMEIRTVVGGFGEMGPAAVWFRLRAPVIAGESPSPAVRAAAAADFGNGISMVLPPQDYTFVNPDLTMYLTRPPAGEWVRLDARTELGDLGSGVATSVLSDQRGVFGTAAQSLFVERR